MRTRLLRAVVVAVLLLLAAQPAVAAVAVRSSTGVQGAGGFSSTTPAFGANPQVGDTIVVVNVAYGASQAPTDSKGNTYIQIGVDEQISPVSDPTIWISMWYAANIQLVGAGFTITAHSASAQQCVTAFDLSGVATAPYNGDFKGVSSNTGTVTTGASAPAPAANSIFIAVASANTLGANMDAPFTNDANAQFHTQSTFYGLDGGWRIASAVQTATWTSSTSYFGAVMASFKPPAASAALTRTLLGVGQ